MSLIHSAACPMFLAQTSIIPRPQTFTAKASGRNRLPLHDWQGRADIYRSI